jgi:hypothetical protein
MIQVLTGLGYGIIGLAVMIGIGIVLLVTMGNTIGGTGNTTIQTIVGYLGTSNGGLASWIPLVIIFVIGMVFLGAFMTRKGKMS